MGVGEIHRKETEGQPLRWEDRPLDDKIERTFLGAVSIRDSKNVTVYHQDCASGCMVSALQGWERSLTLREESITLRERALSLWEKTLQRRADSLAVWEASRQAIRDARHGVQAARAVEANFLQEGEQ